MALSFIDSPFPTKVTYEAWLRMAESEKAAELRAAQRGAYAPDAQAAGDSLPEWLRKQIYGEHSAEEKVAMLKDAQSGWRKKRFTQLPVEGTTRGEFIAAGIIDGQSEAQRIVNLPFGSPERAAAEAEAKAAASQPAETAPTGRGTDV